MRMARTLATVGIVFLAPGMLSGCPTTGGAPPMAAFTADVTVGPAPLSVQFSDVSVPGDSEITAWAWDFGDGGGSTEQNPAHMYAADGTYSVSLTVTTSAGTGTATTTNYITVTDITGTDPPAAAFTADVTEGEAPLTVTFTDASNAGSAPITEWAWVFGDGGSSTAQNPSNTYETPGVYTVSLTVRTVLGTGAESKTGYITVDPPISMYTVRINEVLASNATGLTDEDGLFSDWIELYNYGPEPLSLLGWSLTDDLAMSDFWTFPGITLDAGAYLVIFASGNNRRPTDGSNLHTNFRLARAGEYLALFAPEITNPIDAFAPAFPEQQADISYGVLDDQLLYFDVPTPGTENIGGRAEIGPPEAPAFSAARGHYDSPVTLTLSTPSPGAFIRYTLDGTEPTAGNALLYEAPLSIVQHSIVRAASFRSGDDPSDVITHTLLIAAAAAERSLPALCLAGDAAEAFYEPNGVMAIADGVYAPDATGIDAWSPVGPADYNNPMQRGVAFERAVSFEFLEDAGNVQLRCGLRVHGSGAQRSHYRRSDDWTNPYEKFSFRFYFTNDYEGAFEDYPVFAGDGAQRHETLILRGGNLDQFNPFIRERMLREAAWSMGQNAARGRFVSLYINAEYKGYFELLERYDETYFRETFQAAGAWDIIDDDGIVEGSDTQWDALVNFAGLNDLSQDTAYQQAAVLLDVDSFIDYLIVELYGANAEWVSENWLTARESAIDSRFKMFVTSAEATWNPLFINANGFVNFPQGLPAGQTGLNQAGGQLARLYRGLVANAGFRTRFAERVALHFSESGGLSQANLTALFDDLHATLNDAIPGFDTYIRDTWIPQREAVVLQHFENEGLYTPPARK